MVLIKIIYGQYESNGIIRHKKQRLWGLENELKKQGYIVEFQCTPQYERLMIEMLDHIIFQCNIKSLRFNCLSAEDEVCKRIMKAVIEAETRLYSKTNLTRLSEIIPNDNGKLCVKCPCVVNERFLKKIEYFTPETCYSQ